ncbi:AT-hook motif nuclear-localized protein [Heracleum sosnowskyi]|uniref:AT-hook motif nuclear-localized protein n=1 Tax=Heracleum sosnowskyi TaxID=360622 RepID=A0AAD8H5S3_9APIA|nr:AT-hook motif nuclear-localized protein [Heracleum sosnowskyi]
MEGKEDIQISGVENMIHFGDSVSPVAAPATAPEGVAVAGETPVTMEGKKKRGRPRKYGADGNLALSPMPISASIPLSGGGDYSSSNKGKIRGPYKKKQKLEFESPPGDRVAYLLGANFTTHIITVTAGEDVSMRIMSFSQQGSRAICVLAANGAISNVTLRQPNSSGGTLTYEGRFEILSLSGSFMPTDNGGTKSISGGMSVSLAGPDGRVTGGGLAGLLIAAGPVQVVIGSFLTGYQPEPKPKKQRPEFAPTLSSVPSTNHNNAGGNYVNGQTTVAAENNLSLPREGRTVIAAEKNISLPGEGQNVVAAEDNISIPREGQTIVAAENDISFPGEVQTVVAAENNILLPGEVQTTVDAENNRLLPGERQTIVAAEDKISPPLNSEKLSPSKFVFSC